MKKKFTKRLLSWVMAAAMVISMLPISAMATGTDGDDVARIGDVTYTSIDDAIAQAEDGATIELLTDVTATKTFYKPLTFTGGHTLNMDVYGWRYNGDLTFDGANFNIISDSDSPVANNGEAGRWFTMVLSGSITARNGANVTFTFDSVSGTNCAIYAGIGVTINVESGSAFSIYGKNTRGVPGQGIQLDSTAGTGIFVTGNSTFLIDGTNRGYVNSPTVYVKDSTFTVQNCTANGSNGGNFTAINSKITYQNNAGHGLSAGNVIIKNSDFVADNNGYYGIYASAGFSVDGTSKVTVTHNSYDGDFAGLKLTGGVTDGKVESGAVVTITDNYCSGLSNNGVCVFEEGVDLTIMNNDNRQGGETGSHGGGIYNSGSGANLTLPSDAVIYNNHALTDGDDIFNNTTATITFGKVDPTWVLDDCDHLIDGWYDDAEGTRWEAHADTEEGNHIVEFTDFGENGLATVTGLQALKAAHGKDAKDKTSYPGLDKTIVVDGQEVNHDDVAAGDTVNFKLTSNVPNDLLNYILPDEVKDPEVVTPAATNALVPIEDRGEYILTFHDQMDDAFVNATAPVVTLDRAGTDNDVTLTAGTHYTYTTDTGDGCDFHIVMDLVDLYDDIITNADIENATPIIVTYTATLNEDASAGTYKNTAWVTYKTEESEEVTVTVDTYGIDIFKYDQANPDTGLEGAKFELYQKDNEGNVVEGSVVELTSGADGTVSLEGLDAGTYYLKEITPPEGYVGSDTELTIVIPDQAGNDNMVNVKFANSQIPHTGGMGTTLFSIVGGALIATAGVIFVISRKKRARNAA